ncbi:hypothetical protein [Planococcus maritimus]|uniref:hypothetical protein n=1 Tax=Planococcus maritimus TaxID=192421 RepID=UPI00232DEE30|nr:hypothetical protein [Planococcus maritimus]
MQEAVPQIQPSVSLTRATSISTAMNPKEKELDDRFRQYFDKLNRGRVQNLALHVPEKKYKEFLERMSTTRIEGASYILSSNHVWRPIILKWLEENYYVGNWTVSVQLIRDILKNTHVEFTENREEILKVPIKDFLVVYQKSLKRDLKVKSSFIIKS